MDSEDALSQHYARLVEAFPKDVFLRFIIIPFMLWYTTTMYASASTFFSKCLLTSDDGYRAVRIVIFSMLELSATCIVTDGPVCTYQAVVILPFAGLPVVMIHYELYLVHRYCQERGFPVNYNSLV